VAESGGNTYIMITVDFFFTME